jgi:hypothetical protein
MNCIARYWVSAGALLATTLLAAAIVYGSAWPLPLLLIYLHSPGYMLHQVEEHTGDRFRTFVNQRMFGGVEALTTADVLWINIGGAWGGNLAALAAAWFASHGWALAAPYLMVVNAVSHIAALGRVRDYNPGLLTSALMFLPLGGATLYLVPASLAQHALGLAVSVGFHAVIVANAYSRAARAKAATPVAPAGVQ